MCSNEFTTFPAHVKILRKTHKNLKELPLHIYKDYDAEMKSFSILVRVVLDQYPSDRSVLLQQPWTNAMWKWSAKQWTYFFLAQIHSLELNIKSLQRVVPGVNHKIQKSGSEKEYKQFINSMNTVASREWMMRNTGKSVTKNVQRFQVVFVTTGSLQKDISAWFDSEMWKMRQLRILQIAERKKGMVHGWDFIDSMKNKQSFPSHSYAVITASGHKQLRVFDNETNKMYDSIRKYVKYRFLSSLGDEKRNHPEYVRFVSFCVKFILNVREIENEILPNDMKSHVAKWRRIWIKYRLIIFDPVCLMFAETVMPRIHKFVSSEFLPNILRKNCNVCDAIEVFQDTKIEKNRKYVHKMKHCPCGKLFVCSKQCQKISWNTKPWMHRLSCRNASKH